MKTLKILVPVFCLLSFVSPVFALVPDDYGASADYCPALTVTLQYGARDASSFGQVTELQKFLAGYYHYDPNELVTGYFGRTTKKYVQQFQKDQGFPIGAQLGIAGSMTRASIANVCGQGQQQSAQTDNAVAPTSDTNAASSVPSAGNSLEQQVADLLNLVTSLQGQLTAQQTVAVPETTIAPVEATVIPTESQSISNEVVPTTAIPVTPAAVIAVPVPVPVVSPSQSPVIVPQTTITATVKTNINTPQTSSVSTVSKDTSVSGTKIVK